MPARNPNPMTDPSPAQERSGAVRSLTPFPIIIVLIGIQAPGFTPGWSHTVYTPGRTRNLGIPERALINFERALAFEEPSLPSVPYNIGEHIHIGGYHGPRWQMMANAPGNHHHRNTSAPQVEAEELQPGWAFTSQFRKWC